MSVSPALPVPVRDWLSAFATAVRDRDYEAGRALCAPVIEGFGTVAGRYTGLDALEASQWRSVWDRTCGFDFDLDGTTVWQDGDLTVLISDWSSTGTEPDGSPRQRTGRATIALRQDPSGLRAIHTHFSMTPGTVS